MESRGAIAETLFCWDGEKRISLTKYYPILC